MKNVKFNRIMMLAMFGLFLSTFVVGANLVQNSSFEDWNLDTNMPDYWFSMSDSNELTFFRDTNSHTGLYSIMFNDDNVDHGSGPLIQVIDVYGNRLINGTFYSKTLDENETEMAYMYVSQDDENNTYLWNFDSTLTNKWEYVDINIDEEEGVLVNGGFNDWNFDTNVPRSWYRTVTGQIDDVNVIPRLYPDNWYVTLQSSENSGVGLASAPFDINQGEFNMNCSMYTQDINAMYLYMILSTNKIWNFDTNSFDEYLGGAPTVDQVYVSNAPLNSWERRDLTIYIDDNTVNSAYILIGTTNANGAASIDFDECEVNSREGGPGDQYFRMFDVTEDWEQYNLEPVSKYGDGIFGIMFMGDSYTLLDDVYMDYTNDLEFGNSTASEVISMLVVMMIIGMMLLFGVAKYIGTDNQIFSTLVFVMIIVIVGSIIIYFMSLL